MRGLDIFHTLEIGDGPGYLQDPRIDPGTQTKLIDRRLEKSLARLLDLAKLLDMAVCHLGIAVNLHPFESAKLKASRPVHPFLDLPGRFPLFPTGQIPILHCRDFDVDIDPVHQGAGDLGPVTLDLGDGTDAFLVKITVITGRTFLRCLSVISV